MFLFLHEATLVQDQRKRIPEDQIIYSVHWFVHGQGNVQVFHLWNEPVPQRYRSVMSEPVRYGTCYEDARGMLCIIPDVWNDTEALYAKDAIYA